MLSQDVCVLRRIGVYFQCLMYLNLKHSVEGFFFFSLTNIMGIAHLKEKLFLNSAILSCEVMPCKKYRREFLSTLLILTYISENASILGPLTMR